MTGSMNSSRSGDLHVTKECSAFSGLAGDFCTITSSDVEEIEVGSRVVYAQAAGTESLDTDIVLDAGGGNTATGHVVLDLATARGEVTFSGGTGTFADFEARAAVWDDPEGLSHWDGTYRFDPRD